MEPNRHLESNSIGETVILFFRGLWSLVTDFHQGKLYNQEILIHLANKYLNSIFSKWGIVILVFSLFSIFWWTCRYISSISKIFLFYGKSSTIFKKSALAWFGPNRKPLRSKGSFWWRPHFNSILCHHVHSEPNKVTITKQKHHSYSMIFEASISYK